MKDFYSRFVEYLNYVKNINITQDDLDNFVVDSIYDQKYVNLVENKAEFTDFYNRILKVRVHHNSSDHIKLVSFLTDWYASLKTLSNEHRNLSNPLAADLEDLDSLLES